MATVDVKITNQRTGLGVSGYTVRAFNYSTNAAGYTGAAVVTYTDNGDGVYYGNCTKTFKATIVVSAAGSTAISIPPQKKGIILWGDNIVTITPGGVT